MQPDTGCRGVSPVEIVFKNNFKCFYELRRSGYIRPLSALARKLFFRYDGAITRQVYVPRNTRPDFGLYAARSDFDSGVTRIGSSVLNRNVDGTKQFSPASNACALMRYRKPLVANAIL